jgi:hypothetical protein
VFLGPKPPCVKYLAEIRDGCYYKVIIGVPYGEYEGLEFLSRMLIDVGRIGESLGEGFVKFMVNCEELSTSKVEGYASQVMALAVLTRRVTPPFVD